MPAVFRKRDDSPGATALEAAGLAWLAEAEPDGGAAVVPVRTGPGWLEEPSLTDVGVTPAAAEAFGRALAVTHAAGAPAFGAAPPGWDGRTRMGRSDIRLRPCEPEPAGTQPRRWGEFYADDRIAPYIGPSVDAGSLTRSGAAVLERVCERLRDGELDSAQPRLVEEAARQRGDRIAVSRTHGDLWTGNILWAPRSEAAAVRGWSSDRAEDGARAASRRSGSEGAAGAGSSPGSRDGVVGVLIDPLAQGAHAETDLAALGVFGQRFLDRIVASYDEASPLADGWRERIGLHQLHILIIHTYLFGGGYGSETVGVARRYA